VTDGTEVDTGELRTFAEGIGLRGEAISNAAKNVNPVLSDKLAFGVLNTFFVNDLMGSADCVVRGLHLLGEALSTDETEVRNAARVFDTTEGHQVHRFGGGHGG
jgi:methanogenic corrinoid protein MtbC1